MSNDDGLIRCAWPGADDALYTRYHDTEWGVPKTDDRQLFEKLVLEGFQAGLSWITILRKRETFRTAFDQFDAEKIVRYDAKKIESLMADAGIIRNRMKIEATIDNAKAYLKLREETTLARFLWQFIDFTPLQNSPSSMKDVLPETPTSKTISKALKAKGFRFVGPTTVYAFMQASGFVNDHFVDCHRYGPCALLQKKIPAFFKSEGHFKSEGKPPAKAGR